MLLAHKGAQEVSETALAEIEAPNPTETWFPLSHTNVLETVKGTLSEAGFHVQKQTLAVSNQNHRFFGTLDLKTQIGDGISLSVGVRNSTDKSFPIGFCCGNRVFVCDNLAFSSQVTIARRHTRYGETRFTEATAEAVSGLHQFQRTEAKRVDRLQQFSLSQEVANSLMLRAFETGIVSSRLLPLIIKEWREPTYEEFQPRTAWSLFNAITHVLKDRQRVNPQAAALQTIRLQNLLEGRTHARSNEVSQCEQTLERGQEVASGVIPVSRFYREHG